MPTAAKIPIIPTTTRSSIKENPLLYKERLFNYIYLRLIISTNVLVPVAVQDVS